MEKKAWRDQSVVFRRAPFQSCHYFCRTHRIVRAFSDVSRRNNLGFSSSDKVILPCSSVGVAYDKVLCVFLC